MLLHQLDVSEEGRFEELSVERDEAILDAGPQDRFLLDLSDTDDDGLLRCRRTLAAYRATVGVCGARLVAILPAGREYLLEAEFAPLVVHLGRPRGTAVLSRHLRVDGVDFAPEQLTEAELVRFSAASPMREIARFAGLVRRARDSGRYGGDFASWCAEAMAAVTDRTGEAAAQVNAHRSVPERALLLAAAMLDGATGDAVFHGSRLLLRNLDHREDETPRLAQADFGEELKCLRIQRDDEGRVGFERLAYDGAIRTHFWVNFPDLREGMRDWVAQCVAMPDLTPDDRGRLVSRVVEQVLGVDRPDDVRILVESWTRPTASRPFRVEAAAALETGLGHERYGATFREQAYTWAISPALPTNLVHVLARVCHQVIARTHPNQALVRLHHLALHPGREEAEAAREALFELAVSSERLYRRLIDRLLHRQRGRPELNLALLVRLLEPDVLPFRRFWPDLIRAWRTVMAERPPQEWEATVRRWLSTVRQDSGWDPMLDILTSAAADRPDALNRLYVIAGSWARNDPPPLSDGIRSREMVADRLRHKIDVAQGFDPMEDEPDVSDSGEAQ
ncbi:hypothetical protein ACFRCG_38490 [Embleya sp. NPDC056575]|uniref:hypothetical protein n=1 Tax=unclassified Embleya TaxID=2699296 RepID=UPI0036CE4FC7